MQIPKLVSTSIIARDTKLATIGKKKGIRIEFDPYYKIYTRTKNRRIKRKQIKKSVLLSFKEMISDSVKEQKPIIYIDGVRIGCENK